MKHGDVGKTSDMYSVDLLLRRHTIRMHKENAWWDDVLQLEGSERVHGMTMDTNNALVVVDPNKNQLKREDDVGKEDTDDDRSLRQRCIAITVQQTGR